MQINKMIRAQTSFSNNNQKYSKLNTISPPFQSLSSISHNSSGILLRSMTENKELSDLSKNQKTELTIKVSGLSLQSRKMEEESKFGLMVQDTMVFGRMEWPMVLADLFMLKAMFMKVSGLMTRQMVTESTLILTVQGMKATGFKISNMVGVLNNGLMEPNTMEITSVV